MAARRAGPERQGHGPRPRRAASARVFVVGLHRASARAAQARNARPTRSWSRPGDNARRSRQTSPPGRVPRTPTSARRTAGPAPWGRRAETPAALAPGEQRGLERHRLLVVGRGGGVDLRDRPSSWWRSVARNSHPNRGCWRKKPIWKSTRAWSWSTGEAPSARRTARRPGMNSSPRRDEDLPEQVVLVGGGTNRPSQPRTRPARPPPSGWPRGSPCGRTLLGCVEELGPAEVLVLQPALLAAAEPIGARGLVRAHGLVGSRRAGACCLRHSGRARPTQAVAAPPSVRLDRGSSPRRRPRRGRELARPSCSTCRSGRLDGPRGLRFPGWRYRPR